MSTLESANGELPDVVATRIQEREAEAAQINERLAVVENSLAAARSRDINCDHLAQTLSQFTELWEVLYPRERVELVSSLVESVTYHDATDEIKISFKHALENNTSSN